MPLQDRRRGSRQRGPAAHCRLTFLVAWSKTPRLQHEFEVAVADRELEIPAHRLELTSAAELPSFEWLIVPYSCAALPCSGFVPDRTGSTRMQQNLSTHATHFLATLSIFSNKRFSGIIV